MSDQKPTTETAQTPACLMTIFGASGDLTKRLLLPSLYNLVAAKVLPDAFQLLGVAMEQWDDAKFKDHISTTLKQVLGTGRRRHHRQLDQQPRQLSAGQLRRTCLLRSCQRKDRQHREIIAVRRQSPVLPRGRPLVHRHHGRTTLPHRPAKGRRKRILASPGHRETIRP